MSPVYYENQPLPVVYAQNAGTEEKTLLESTLDAYEVDELTELDLGRYLAAVVVDRDQIASDARRSADRDGAEGKVRGKRLGRSKAVG